MLARVRTAALVGPEARPIVVEVDVERGLPAFYLVGLPDGAIRESRERVLAALSNCGFGESLRKITVNLAPADERKSGTGFDLPIALAILIAEGRVARSGRPVIAALGELGLDGRVRPVPGSLPATAALARIGVREILVAPENAGEAALVERMAAIPTPDLKSAVDHLSGLARIHPAARPAEVDVVEWEGDWSDVRGQQEARRALEIAAAGFHNVLLVGPPGAGKTFLARRFPSILPVLEADEALEVTSIHSAWGRLSPDRPLVRRPPFRSPHHTVSPAGLLGGGSPPRPGEVSLAHRGVLFLDELPEFRRDALEGLRQPLEDGEVTIGRATGTSRWPTRFILIGAMNPCPCGWRGEPTKGCRCTPTSHLRYRARISGPLLDRIDLHVQVRPVAYEALQGNGAASAGSREVGASVEAARRRQSARNGAGRWNARIDPLDPGSGCGLDRGSRAMLRHAHERMGLSARGHTRVLRVARTIADLCGAERIDEEHLAEALQFRESPREGSPTGVGGAAG